MDKIALMDPLRLPEREVIRFLTNGISSIAIKAAAAALKVDSLDDYLREMQQITESCCSSFKGSSPTLSRKNKHKDNTAFGNSEYQKKKDVFCTYCRKKNHTKEDCFKLKKKKPLLPILRSPFNIHLLRLLLFGDPIENFGGNVIL